MMWTELTVRNSRTTTVIYAQNVAFTSGTHIQFPEFKKKKKEIKANFYVDIKCNTHKKNVLCGYFNYISSPRKMFRPTENQPHWVLLTENFYPSIYNRLKIHSVN